jgi:hypothetical protein
MLCWYNLGSNKLMSIVILVMKEFFVAFDFKLQKYLLSDKNRKNLWRSFVIFISLFLVAYT